MASSRIEQIVRRFRENGLKLLLQDPGNAHDLLALTATRLLDRLDFAHLTVDPTTYIAADYRHLASDLVLRVPFRTRRGRGTVTVYILIEHQSEPDPLMRLRVLDYVVQIYKRQTRAWLARHPSLKGFAFDPVLPVVLYTGTASWPELPRLVALVKQGAEFADFLPDLRPLYVNLPAVAPDALEASGALGWVLELIQQRRAGPEAFRALLGRVVQNLEGMPARERQRWLELLSYIQALVYHDREPPERERLREVILASVRTDERRRELERVVMTIADVLREEGRQQGLRQGALNNARDVLLNLLRSKFGRVPRALEKTIRTTDDLGQLNAWVIRAGMASTLEEARIGPGSSSTP
jgi:predicted transposase YdaD